MDKSNTTTISLAGFFLLILMFWGEPDLADAIIYYLTGVQGW